MITAGYVRSTGQSKKDIDVQLAALNRFGLLGESILIDQRGGNPSRLDSLIEDLDRGDTLVCASIDRLGESTGELLERLAIMFQKGIQVRTADGQFDIAAATRGSETSNPFTALAVAHRRLLKQRAGRSPRARGSRPKIVTPDVIARIDELLRQEPRLTKNEVAKAAGISRSTLYSHLAERSALAGTNNSGQSNG